MPATIIYADYSETISEFSTHYHDCNQLLFVAEGAAEAEIGGEIYPVQAGTLMIISRFEKHSIRVLSEHYKRYILRINPKQGEGGPIGDRLYSILINRSPCFRNILHCGEETDRICAYFQAIVKEYYSDNLHKEEMLDSLLRILLIFIARMLPERRKNIAFPLENTVFQIQKQLEETYYKNFTLDALARQYHVSAYYLAHMFKNITGKSIFQYLFACRLAAAKSYLARSTKPIGEIAECCGFSDSSNFSRAFRQNTGVTPREFRKNYFTD